MEAIQSLLSLKAHNPEDTIVLILWLTILMRVTSITLTVRIATPPFLPRPQVGFQDVPTGIGSSYIFSLKPGDKVMMSGPYGDFHPNFTSGKEMIWIGGWCRNGSSTLSDHVYDQDVAYT